MCGECNPYSKFVWDVTDGYCDMKKIQRLVFVYDLIKYPNQIIDPNYIKKFTKNEIRFVIKNRRDQGLALFVSAIKEYEYGLAKLLISIDCHNSYDNDILELDSEELKFAKLMVMLGCDLVSLDTKIFRIIGVNNTRFAIGLMNITKIIKLIKNLVEKNDIPFIKLILDYDIGGGSIDFLKQFNNYIIRLILIKKYDNGLSYFIDAVLKKDYEFAKKLIDYKCNSSYDPSLYDNTISQKDISLAKILVKAGCDIDKLHQYHLKNMTNNEIKFLIQNYKNKFVDNGRTVFIESIQLQNYALAKLLIKYGCDFHYERNACCLFVGSLIDFIQNKDAFDLLNQMKTIYNNILLQKTNLNKDVNDIIVNYAISICNDSQEHRIGIYQYSVDNNRRHEMQPNMWWDRYRINHIDLPRRSLHDEMANVKIITNNNLVCKGYNGNSYYDLNGVYNSYNEIACTNSKYWKPLFKDHTIYKTNIKWSYKSFATVLHEIKLKLKYNVVVGIIPLCNKTKTVVMTPALCIKI